jgi:dipeptidyl-peptidase-4
MVSDRGTAAAESFPRQSARTRSFRLGRPRTFTVSPDGSRVVFVRSQSGDDPVGRLWVLDPVTGSERLVADPLDLLGTGPEELTPEERAQRERRREIAAGLVAYATDDDVRIAAFTLSGRLFVADLVGDGAAGVVGAVELPANGPVMDPRPDPTGARIAYASNGALRVIEVSGANDHWLIGPDEGETSVTWGLAEFAAAEELERHRGFWWSPEGRRLIVERCDESNVSIWNVSDPAVPAASPMPMRYPAAGTANADVSLWLVDLGGGRVPISWDSTTFEYVTAVRWQASGPPLVQVMDRRQSHARTLAVEVATGGTRVVREQTDPCWVDVIGGVPAWLSDGRLLTVEPVGDRYALCADGVAMTPEGLQVRAVHDVGPGRVLFSATTEPTESHLWWWTPDSSPTVTAVTKSSGVHAGAVGGSTLVVVSSSLDEPLPRATVWHPDGQHEVRSYGERPTVTPRPTLGATPEHDLRMAVLFPTGWEPGSGRLPVLMAPYGGPHAQEVVRAQGAYLSAQWFADQGFAVVIADGRGTPRDPRWERAARFDLAEVVLADQVEALQTAAATFADLDLDRVGIRGWSFGGYLAALAVLERPDVFHAAVAGAPVTDWTLYDTAYTERYLGLPQERPDVYERLSLLPKAEALRRPLMLIHGLADDNVFAAHTLQLSGRLMAAGRPHTVLPLSGITHMTPRADVAENLLLLQLEFLRQALGD